MKILHIINNLGTGGAERLLSDLVPLLDKEKDIEVEILVLNLDKSLFTEKLEHNNIKIYNLDTKLKSIKNIFKLTKLIKLNHYNVIHAHLFPTLYYVAFASLANTNKNTKFYYTEHSTNNKRRNKQIFRLVEKFVYSRYDKIICISDSVESNLNNWIDNVKNKTRIIHNGISIENFVNAEKICLHNELGINCKKSNVLCMIGRFNDAKDHKTLIDAFSMLEEQNYLLLIGEGNTQDYYKQYVNKLNLTDRVFFLNNRNDVPNILKSIDLFILSSHWEGFGLVAIEAMASKVPVIVSNVDGMKQIVDNGAVLFNKNDVHDLKIKIEEVLNSENLRKNLIEKGSIRAKTFSLDYTAKRYLDLYKEGEKN